MTTAAYVLYTLSILLSVASVALVVGHAIVEHRRTATHKSGHLAGGDDR